MSTVFEWSIPAWVLLLVGVGLWELRQHRRNRRRGTPLSGNFTAELTAMLYGTKRVELDHRASMSLMAEQHEDGAPSQAGVDLSRNTVSLSPRPSSGDARAE